VFHPEAALEFEEALSFYKERGRRLAGRIAGEVPATIRRIIETPERWRVLEADVFTSGAPSGIRTFWCRRSGPQRCKEFSRQ
jgi:hypothetical protein